MIDALQVSCVILVACATVPGVAHALEFPGKRRLDKGAYFAVQPSEAARGHWRRQRDRLEYSHVARACPAFLSFVALVIAVSSASAG